MSALYITTPIYYVNDRPHLGHAYASIHADVLRRYAQMAGLDTYFVTGTDEHGEKIAKAAALNHEDCQHFVDRNASQFEKAWRYLNVEPSFFIRTTHPVHQAFVSQMLGMLYERGDIYLSEYEGWYSVGQERFVTSRELLDGKLPEDKDPPLLRKETNYFFRMEKYREWIQQFLEQNPNLIQPNRYASEIQQLLKEPIGDLSISRPKERLSWGIPLPWDKDHVTYVWFDALLSYISALKLTPGGFDAYWPFARHIIGKDILKPHALFWLAMCRAMELTPYRRLYVSGHLLGKDGRKMSKSLNNGVDPLAAAEKYGVDVLRYVLVREIPFGADGIISDQVIAHRLDNDLANDLGNLASRTLAMIEKYCGGQVPAAHSLSEIDKAIVRTAEELRAQVMSWVDEMKISVAVEAMMNFVRDLNRYVSEKQPWLLFKDTTKKVELGTTLCLLHEGLVCAADLLWPVMPKKMEELRISLGLSPLPGSLEVKWDFNGGAQVAKHPPILFPKAQLLLSEETQS